VGEQLPGRSAGVRRDGQRAAQRTLDGGLPPGSVGPRIAAAAAGAILVELVDIPPGPRRDEAITAAMRFLDAGIESLGGPAP
jgi:hypothetical protein